jgi:hypothetical protein
MTPAELIATNLHALPHPDGTPRQLPGFATQFMPEPLREQVNASATDIGHAIIHLLEQAGYRVTNEPTQPETLDTSYIASVHCAHCNARVLQLNVTNPERVLTQQHFALTKCPQT